MSWRCAVIAAGVYAFIVALAVTACQARLDVPAMHADGRRRVRRPVIAVSRPDAERDCPGRRMTRSAGMGRDHRDRVRIEPESHHAGKLRSNASHAVEDQSAMQAVESPASLEFSSRLSRGFATCSIDWPRSGRRRGSGGLPFAVPWSE